MEDTLREAFVRRVKEIDPLFKRRDLAAFWPSLRQLVAMGPDRADLSKKKSHYLASLAARSLARGDAESAIAFLDFADRSVVRSHLTAFLLEEREEFRVQAERVLRNPRERPRVEGRRNR